MAPDVIIRDGQTRELTPEEEQEHAVRCFKIDERIRDAISTGRAAMWELSLALYEFNLEEGWTALGLSSQAEWLAQPEVNMKKSMFHKLVRRHRVLAIEKHVDPETLAGLDPSKLDIVMPVIEAGHKKVSVILDDVRELGARDLAEKYIVRRTPDAGGPDDDPQAAKVQEWVDLDEPPVSAATLDGERGEELPVIDVEPVEDPEVARARERVVHAVGVVDSYVDLGGDRRKARRALDRLFEGHPLLVALLTVEHYVHGAAEDASYEVPTREQAQAAWRTLSL